LAKRVSGTANGSWSICRNIIVHVMLPRVREFYGLERLWDNGTETPATVQAPRPVKRGRQPS